MYDVIHIALKLHHVISAKLSSDLTRSDTLLGLIKS